MKRWYKRLRPFKRHKAKLSSVQIIALGFFIMILVGTGLLMLPWATQIPGGASFGDALFTATSASCVTGLVLQDTGTYWSTFGQVVIICLIQIGGLGFMTIATLFLLLLRRRLGLREREVMVSSVSYGRLGGLSAFVRQIFLGTLLAEGVGAALLSMRFVQDFGWGRGIYYGVWHAVSAFCNGGFDLMGPHSGPFSSFTAYAGDPLVSLTICALILVGGLGFLVWRDVRENGLRLRRYSLHSKLMLTATVVLTAGGAALFWWAERDSLLAGMDPGQQALVSLFQAVSPRTAGFNTVDLAKLTSGGGLLTIVLMFIGAGPGSTGGGVKVTTVVVCLLTLASYVRGKREVGAFNRRLDEEQIHRSAAGVTLYMTMAMAGGFLLLTTQPFPLQDALFEVFSALSTVGLSTGITRALSPFNRGLLIVMMYCGRIGSLSMMMALAQRLPPRVKDPVERITIG